MTTTVKSITRDELRALPSDTHTEMGMWRNIKLDTSNPIHREIDVYKRLYMYDGDTLYIGYASGVTYIMPRSEIPSSILNFR